MYSFFNNNDKRSYRCVTVKIQVFGQILQSIDVCVYGFVALNKMTNNHFCYNKCIMCGIFHEKLQTVNSSSATNVCLYYAFFISSSTEY